MTLADEIRALLKAHGPLTAVQLRALLPDRRNKDGTTRRTLSRDVMRSLHDGCKQPKDDRLTPTLQRIPGDRYQFIRDPSGPADPEKSAAAKRAREAKRTAKRKAERHARGIVPLAARGIQVTTPAQREARAKSYSHRAQNTAEAAQAINRKHMGLRDMPADDRPCTDAWLAANADKYERLPSSGPFAVSPASRFQRLKVTA